MGCVQRPMACVWDVVGFSEKRSEWGMRGDGDGDVGVGVGVGWCLRNPVKCIVAGTSSSDYPDFKSRHSHTYAHTHHHNADANFKSKSKSKPKPKPKPKPKSKSESKKPYMMHSQCPPNLEELIFTTPPLTMTTTTTTTTIQQPLDYNLPTLSTNLSLIISTLESTSILESTTTLYIPPTHSNSNQSLATLTHNLQSLLQLINTLHQESTDHATLLILAKQDLYYATLSISHLISKVGPKVQKAMEERGEISWYRRGRYIRDVQKMVEGIEKGYMEYFEVAAREMMMVVVGMKDMVKLYGRVNRQVERIQEIGREWEWEWEWERLGKWKNLSKEDLERGRGRGEGEGGGVVGRNLEGELRKIFPPWKKNKKKKNKEIMVKKKKKTILETLLIMTSAEKAHMQSQIKSYEALIEDWYTLPHEAKMRCWFPGVWEEGKIEEIWKDKRRVYELMGWMEDMMRWGLDRMEFARVLERVGRDEREEKEEEMEDGDGDGDENQ